MSTWYYVTVGRTLRDSSRCWTQTADGIRPKPWKKYDAYSTAEILRNPHAYASFVDWRGLAERLAEEAVDETRAHTIARDHFDVGCWHTDRVQALPAELATLFRLQNHANLVPKPEDHVVFIHAKGSDKQPMKNEALLMKAMLQQLFEKELFAVPPNSVEAWDLERWDPTEAGSFIVGIHRLYTSIMDTNHCPDRTKKCLILTGGYKGIGLVLLAGAGEDLAEMDICYLHEDSPQVVHINTSVARKKFKDRKQ